MQYSTVEMKMQEENVKLSLDLRKKCRGDLLDIQCALFAKHIEVGPDDGGAGAEDDGGGAPVAVKVNSVIRALHIQLCDINGIASGQLFEGLVHRICAGLAHKLLGQTFCRPFPTKNMVIEGKVDMEAFSF